MQRALFVMILFAFVVAQQHGLDTLPLVQREVGVGSKCPELKIDKLATARGIVDDASNFQIGCHPLPVQVGHCICWSHDTQHIRTICKRIIRA